MFTNQFFEHSHLSHLHRLRIKAVAGHHLAVQLNEPGKKEVGNHWLEVTCFFLFSFLMDKLRTYLLPFEAKNKKQNTKQKKRAILSLTPDEFWWINTNEVAKPVSTLAGTAKLQCDNEVQPVKTAVKTIGSKTQNFPLLHFAIGRRQLWRTLFKLNSILFLHNTDDHNSWWHFLREMLLDKLQGEADLNSCICWPGSLQLCRTQNKWQAIPLTHSFITSKSSDSYFILQRHIMFLIELPGGEER